MAAKPKLVVLFLLVAISLPFFAQTISELQSKLKNANDSIDISQLNEKIGQEYFYKGEFINALNYFTKSLKIAETMKHEYNVASCFNNISAVYMETGKYKEAEEYAIKSLQLFLKLNDDNKAIANTYTSLANVYYMEIKDSLAEYNYKKAIEYRHLANDSIGLISANKNLGALYFEMGDTIQGISYTEDALRYLTKRNKPLEWFSSFLSLGEIYTYSGNLTKGKHFIDSCTVLLPKINAFHKIDDYYYLLHFYHSKMGNLKLALDNYKLYSNYKDSVLNTESNKQLLDIKTQYETEKKEQQIKAQQELLELEKKEKILYTSILSLGIALLVVFLIFIRNKHKHKTELLLKEQQEIALSKVLEAEEKERIRIAKDLHDGIVQDITAIKLNLNEIFHQATDDVKSKLDNINKELDSTSKEVREISYQLMPVTLKELGLEKALEELLNKILPKSNLDFDFQSIGIDIRLPEKIEVNVYRICQELLNNSLKHSKATHISILLQLKNNTLQLTYEDNGVGFDANKVKKGVGLNSLNSRIELIKGSLDFDNEQVKGTAAYIRIPV
ncbi:MAG: sensor histidine kinase [Flavobacteriales bacterium]|nr:sensor histidine kinase [Flavobacteriales bacterium]